MAAGWSVFTRAKSVALENSGRPDYLSWCLREALNGRRHGSNFIGSVT